MDVISRKDARAAGRPHFYTGKPCCNGHAAPRFVSNGTCTACNTERMKEFNTGTRQARTARLRGCFSYMAHPDDHAALLAYAQALDMQRGMVPQVPAAAPALATLTPEQLAAERRRIFGIHAEHEPLDQWGTPAVAVPDTPAYFPKL